MELLIRDTGSIFNPAYLAFYILFVITSGVFIFLLTNYFQSPLHSNQFVALLICVGLISLGVLTKHFVVGFISNILPFKKEMKLYNFNIAIFNFILGVMLIPIVALIAFAPFQMINYIIYGSLGLILLIYLLRTLRALNLTNKLWMMHSFHFIVYLCTVEIAPILILFKYVNNLV